MNIKEAELMIINHYGVMKQLKYFQSEVFELNEAIINAENEYNILIDKGHIAEEIADVQFMLNQFKRYYKITDDEILDVMLSKANRQLERIEKEKVDD